MSLSMALTKRTRGYLPHWEAEGGTYSGTFHLGDSLPANVLAKLTRQREAIKVLLRSGRQLTPMESVRAHQLHRKQIQEYLDANTQSTTFWTMHGTPVYAVGPGSM
jgi:hypothetical protein